MFLLFLGPLAGPKNFYWLYWGPESLSTMLDHHDETRETRWTPWHCDNGCFYSKICSFAPFSVIFLTSRDTYKPPKALKKTCKCPGKSPFKWSTTKNFIFGLRASLWPNKTPQNSTFLHYLPITPSIYPQNLSNRLYNKACSSVQIWAG